MSKRVVILADSTCDLSPALREEYDVRIQPLAVLLGDKEYYDGVDISPDMIYDHYKKHKELPKTAAPNIAAFSDFFARNVGEGEEAVCFTLSATMSATHNNARLAALEHEGVYVVDSKNLSSGGGLLVLAAAEMAREGLCAREIAERCRAMTALVDASFVVDDLEFLHKGGRCSAVAAFGANLLKLKPCIAVRDGKMGVSKKYRGVFLSVLEKYIADRIGDGTGIDRRRAFVTHAGCDESIVARCVELVRSYNLFDEVLIARAGCTVSSHCGKDTLGVLFVRTE
jgi:DegV family protein with EDD domain